MGAFLRRLSEKKVVDAATAVNATNADNATNAGKVDGFSANQLLRVAFDSTDNAPEDIGNMVSATITAPQAGWLILSGSIDAGGTPDFYECRLTVDNGLVAGTVRFSIVDSNNSEENCSTTGVQQVTAGLHHFAFVIRGRNFVSFNDATVWALFVPFDGEGNKP